MAAPPYQQGTAATTQWEVLAHVQVVRLKAKANLEIGFTNSPATSIPLGAFRESQMKSNLSLSILTTVASLSLLSGCMANGEQYAGNVYKAGQTNKQQDAKTVRILAVLPARVEVDNKQGKKGAEVIGGLLGAFGGAAAGHALAHGNGQGTTLGGLGGGAAGVAAGSLVDDKILVDGVSITYTRDHKTLHAVQVGRACEFEPGTAVVIVTEAAEARVQPNATCPTTTEGK